MATGALSSRAAAESACGDGCAAAAAWTSLRGVRPKGCEIIGLPLPAARRVSYWRAECQLGLHFGLGEWPQGWRIHHTMGAQTANCVATTRFTQGPRGGYDPHHGERGFERRAAAHESRRRHAGAWAVEPRHSVANPPGVAPPVDDL